MKGVDEDTYAVKVVDKAVEVSVDFGVALVEVAQVVNAEAVSALAKVFDLVTANVEVDHGLPVLRLWVGRSGVDQAFAIACFRRDDSLVLKKDCAA